MLQEGLGLKVLADGVVGRKVFVFLDARDLPHLNAFFPLRALQGFLQAFRNHWLALVPGPQSPVVQLFVPVAHFETILLVIRPPDLLAVGVQRGPALHMRAPHSPGLDASGATLLAHAPAPRTLNKDLKKDPGLPELWIPLC